MPSEQNSIDTLVRIYEQAERRLNALRNKITAKDFQRRRAALILEQVEQILNDVRAGSSQWADQHLSASYQAGMLYAATSLNRARPEFAMVNRQAVDVFARNIKLELDTSLSLAQKTLSRTIMRAQQEIVRWELILENMATAEIMGASLEQFTNMIVQTLKDGAIARLNKFLPAEIRAMLEKVANNNIIPIMCKDGKIRNYGLKYYSKLVAMTATRQARTEGIINTCLEFGNDLVRISTHIGACPICVPLQGKIFSISGLNKDFPRWNGEIPRHPSCKHSITPVTEEGLKLRGQYDAMSEASRSDTINFETPQAYKDYISNIKKAA